MKINLIILIAIALILTSCTSYKYTSRLARISTDNTYMTPNVVDVKTEFTKKITAASGKHSTPDAAKEEAYFKAINENNIDVLVSPIYELETTSKFLFFGGNSKATVIGYAGYFINPRTLPEEQNKNYEVKLDAVEKMLKLDPIAKEQQKVVILTPSINVDNKGKTTIDKEVLLKSPSILENFNNLYYGNVESPKKSGVTLNTQNNLTQSNGKSEDVEPKKKKKILKKILTVYAVTVVLAAMIFIL